MPPAFNLSQDQTLQFNLRQELILTFGSNDLRFAPRVLGPASFSASTTKFRAPGRFRRRFSAAGFPATSSPAGCPGDLTPSTHTYRLFTLLKSRRPREKHLGRREARLYRTLGSGQQSRRAPVAWSASRGACKPGPHAGLLSSQVVSVDGAARLSRERFPLCVRGSSASVQVGRVTYPASNPAARIQYAVARKAPLTSTDPHRRCLVPLRRLPLRPSRCRPPFNVLP